MTKCSGGILTIGMMFAACGESGAKSQPSLAGFSLGTLWRDVGQALPCHSAPTSYKEKLDSVINANVKWCEPADTVSLLFSSDTLIGITVEIPKGRERPETIWRDRVSRTLTTLFGNPDSVTTKFEPRSWIDVGGSTWVERAERCASCLPQAARRTLKATWRCEPTRLWWADVWISGSDSLSLPFTRIGAIGTPPSSSGSISLSVCHRQNPKKPS